MPAQKRSSNSQQNDEHESSQHRQRRKQSRRGGDKVDQQQHTTSSSLAIPQSSHQQQPQEQEQEQHSNEQQGEEEDQTRFSDQDPVEKSPEYDSDGSGTDPEDFDEIITVLRSDLRNNVQCPICLGIIKKTRTVMGCLHRFCRECIDKSMRLGNNECPACRIHCASRRSLRDDQLCDSLINAIYPDADKYEEEELLFCEEEKTRNEQIQASIAQIYRRQSEALNKRRKLGKEMDDYSPLQSSHSCRKLYSRRRNNQKIEVEGFVDIEKDNANGNDKPASIEKHGTEIKRRRGNRRTGPSTTSPTANTDDGSSEKPVLQNSQEMSAIGGLRNSRNLTWGGGGIRSNTRYGSGGSSRVAGGVSKLIGRLEGIMIAGTEPEPASHEKKLHTEGVEMASAKSTSTSSDIAANSEASMDVPSSSSAKVAWPDVGPQILDGKENLAGISCPSQNDHLVADIHA